MLRPLPIQQLLVNGKRILECVSRRGITEELDLEIDEQNTMRDGVDEDQEGGKKAAPAMHDINCCGQVHRGIGEDEWSFMMYKAMQNTSASREAEHLHKIYEATYSK